MVIYKLFGVSTISGKDYLVTTSKDNWIVGIRAFHDNPYDGHTLPACLHETKRYTGWTPKEAYVDRGYRGHIKLPEIDVHIVDFKHMKRKTRAVRFWFKRRSAIEPVIGHLKYDNKMSRNYLKGRDGDQINAILSACGYNLRKLLAVFFLPEKIWQYFQRFWIRCIQFVNRTESDLIIFVNQ